MWRDRLHNDMLIANLFFLVKDRSRTIKAPRSHSLQSAMASRVVPVRRRTAVCLLCILLVLGLILHFNRCEKVVSTCGFE